MLENEEEKVIKLLLPSNLTLLFSQDTKDHFHNAEKEFLLGLRSMIDGHIDFLDKKLEKTEKKDIKKIEVE